MATDGASQTAETPPSRERDPLTTDTGLLERTQQYLAALLQKKAPDTLLTQSWEEFYRVYSTLIQHFVAAQGLRGPDVNDCVQEVWSTVARKLRDFERPPDRSGLRAWLYTIVRSKASDFLRRTLRHPARNLDSALEHVAAPQSREPEPPAYLEQQWKQAMLQTALEELRRQVSETNFRVLKMRLLEDRSEEETAAALNLTAEQVRYRKHRVQQKLRAILALYTGQDLG